MKIYAVIVTYNAMRNSWIEKSLRSLQESTVSIIPIVIDNGSTDETREFVPSHFPEAIWLPQDKNLGFGQANNVGLRYALEHDADYVLLLNQDATIGHDAIEKMIVHSGNNYLFSPLHLNGDGSRLDYSFKKCLAVSDNSMLDDFLIRGKLHSIYTGPSRETCCVIPAACWFVPISIIKTIGGFNPLFFHYSEDENYFRRLYYHHIGIMVCPQATMYHDRQVHGNLQMFNSNNILRKMLLVATDINLSFGQQIIWYLRIFKNSPKHFMVSLPQLIGKYGKVRKSRRLEKGTGATWL